MICSWNPPCLLMAMGNGEQNERTGIDPRNTRSEIVDIHMQLAAFHRRSVRTTRRPEDQNSSLEKRMRISRLGSFFCEQYLRKYFLFFMPASWFPRQPVAFCPVENSRRCSITAFLWCNGIPVPRFHPLTTVNAKLPGHATILLRVIDLPRVHPMSLINWLSFM
jgi:hypothetical protein